VLREFPPSKPLAGSLARSALVFLLALHAVSPAPAWAAPGQASLADRLAGIRGRVIKLEAGLLDGLKSQKHARDSVSKIQKLIELQREERELGKRRLGELEAKVLELEARRGTLGERIRKQQAEVRRALRLLERASTVASSSGEGSGPESEKLEAPRRKTLANLTGRGLREVEALKIDLADAEQLENRIQDEKQQLAYLFQDLQEKESVLELNRQLQFDLIRKQHQERLAQLESYRKLKSSQQQVEHLIGQFNARLELERANEAERQVSKAFAQAGAFARLKGRLGLPVPDGKVISSFGRSFDPKSRLYIFKKGIEIASAKSAGVRAVSAGKLAYSGELPEYGRVAIVDHGEHFYSICAHLGELKKKAGESVAAGDLIGLTDESGTPVYFEIRARNVAVNPLQWISNEFILSR
jgi:septal ring factor EnvC (AmiA/AmiB activator)